MSSETDSASPPSLNIEKCALIIVDVAGTTTSINFVQDTLFPYALKHAESFLKSKWDEETVKDCVKDLKENDAELDVAAAVKLVKSLSEKNSENKGLKTLQGLIYQQGYESGELKAHIFDDVAEAFESWAKARNVAIYSTGSIESQRLLFKHTTSGDVSAHIFKYFDQSIGAKTESESYKKIAKEFQLEPEEVIFVTDNVEEAKAAKSAGITAVLINREGNPAIPEESSKDFKVISSFNELGLEKAAKRKIEDSPAAVSEEPPAKVAKTSEEEKEKVEEEKPKTEEESSMEVDAPAPEEKVVKAAKTEEAKVSEEQPKTVSETDKKVEAATEKTEPEETTTKSETVSETADDAEMKPVEETKPTEEPKPVETKEEPAKTEKAEEKKSAEEEKSTSEKKVEESVTAETKTDKEEVVEKETEKKVEETTTNDKLAENGEESKPDEKLEEGGEKTKTDESEPKTEEKENKSVLANGVENGNKTDSEIEKNDKESETSEIKKDDLEVNVDKTEVIVKKLEESTESKTVSVEV